MKKTFTRFADAVTKWCGSTAAFTLAVLSVLVWLGAGVFTGFSDRWSFVGNDFLTIVTYLLGFLILHAQKRDTAAVHGKLDEGLRAQDKARDDFVRLEDKTHEEIEAMRDEPDESALAQHKGAG